LEVTNSALHRISLHDVASMHFKSKDSPTMWISWPLLVSLVELRNHPEPAALTQADVPASHSTFGNIKDVEQPNIDSQESIA